MRHEWSSSHLGFMFREPVQLEKFSSNINGEGETSMAMLAGVLGVLDMESEAAMVALFGVWVESSSGSDGLCCRRDAGTRVRWSF